MILPENNQIRKNIKIFEEERGIDFNRSSLIGLNPCGSDFIPQAGCLTTPGKSKGRGGSRLDLEQFRSFPLAPVVPREYR